MLWALRSVVGWTFGAALAWYGAKVAWSCARWAVGRPDALGWLWAELVACCGRLAAVCGRADRRELEFEAYRLVAARVGLHRRCNPDYIRAIDRDRYVSVRRLSDGMRGAVLVVDCPSNTAALVSVHPDWRDAVAPARSLTLWSE